jgi:protein MpaA
VARILTALVALAMAAALPLVPSTASPGGSAAPGDPEGSTTIVATRVLGRSAHGRPIRAWRLGHRGEQNAASVPTVVLIATMHGNEGAPRQILTALRDGPPIHQVDLWVVPVYNPDGLAADSRRNARGVDLNRNYPFHWVDLDGNYESGARPASEPETRAMMRFLRAVRPDWILSFHQPLRGVDTDVKDPAFARRVAHHLNLPRKSLTCGGVCHGTMTGWFNHHFAGTALTVEYGAHPGRHLMRAVAPDQVMAIFDAVRSTTPE